MRKNFTRRRDRFGLTRQTLAEVAEETERLSALTVGPYTDVLSSQAGGGGQTVDVSGFDIFVYARITSGTNPYAWEEEEPVSPGTWQLVSGGRTGDVTDSPAYERNGNTTVPAGAHVRLYLADATGGANGPEWEFDYVQGASPSYSSLTVTNVTQESGGTYDFLGPVSFTGTGPVTVSGPPFLFKTPTTLVQPIFAPQDNSYTGGPTTALTLSTGCWLRISTDTLGVTIKGIGEGIAVSDGEELLVTNVNALAGGLVTLLNESTAESYTAARIWTPDGNNFVLQPRESAWLRYDGDVSRWRVLWKLTTGGFSNPMTTLGDIIYEDATPAAARLAGNTTATKQFLTQTGNGTTSAEPAWGAIATGDLPAGTANNALTHYTGTTVTAGATIFDVTNTLGLHGSVSIKNTGTTAFLNYQITTTDMYGNVTSASFPNLPPNSLADFGMGSHSDAIGYRPYKEVKLVISDSGSHTTYDVYLSLVG